MESLMNPSFILYCKSHSPLYISHKVWVVLISWNSSCLLNVSGITLSRHNLWIKFTFINAKIACQCNWLALTYVCVSKYFKEHCPCIPLSCEIPNSLAMFSMNALQQNNNFHELAISSIKLFALICNDLSSLRQHSANGKPLAFVCISKGFSHSGNYNTRDKVYLPLSSPNAHLSMKQWG